jgi:membrane-associated phospholipid phosphatase
MKSAFVKHKAFFIPYLVLLGVCAFFILTYTKATIHLYLNQYHSPFFDVFFSYLTNMGDGIFLPIFLLVMILFRYRYAILVVLVFIISGLVVQLLKRGFFYDIVRPIEYFKGIAELYLIPGIKMNSAHSFPSGHSATAFGVMICFVFIFKNNGLKALMLVLAALIAYSRVYLSQHFLIDIVVGSLIGTLTAIFLEKYLLKFKNGWLDSNLVLQIQKKERKSNT